MASDWDETTYERIEKAHVTRPLGKGGGLSRVLRTFRELTVGDDETPIEISKWCSVDGARIKVMAFKMTGVCSELCRKRRDNEITEEEYRAARSAQDS